MIRVIVFLLVVLAAASGLAWLADRPGNVVINWEGYEVQATVFSTVVALAILILVAVVIWSIVRGVWQMPAGVGNFFNRRREKRGLEALSSGLIAIGAGDKSLATRYAVQARKSLPNEPLTHILRAQAAQLTGDRATSRRIYEAMLASPDTEPLGLRGLFLEAQEEGEIEAARQFAERAMKLNPKLSWPVHSLFDMQCKAEDWKGAIETLASARKHGHIEKAKADRRKAVLLTAQAQALEDNDPEAAMKLAEEAHNLANDLAPATAIAGRLNAARGNVQKATKILQKGWRKGPHPDIAAAYAYARIGDSPKDRLARVKQLAALSPHSPESPIAIANAAIEAKDYASARAALEPLIDGRLSQRVCTTMARVESEDGGNTGAVREWLARAVNAPRDPAWTADGFVAEEWAPVSPVTGALDAFAWRVPVDTAQPRDAAILNEKIEELVKLGARADIDPEAASEAAAVIGASSPAAAAGAAATASGVVPPAGAAKPEAQATVEPEAKPAPVREAEDAVIVDEAKPAVSAAAPAPATPSPDAGKSPDTKPEASAAVAVAEKKTVEPGGGVTSSGAAENDLKPASEAAPSEATPADSQAPKPDGETAIPMAGPSTPPKGELVDAAANAPAKGATPGPEKPKVADADGDDAAKGETKPGADAKPGQAATGANGSRSTSTAQPAVFVSPRPPDDPGADDEPEVMTPSPAYAGPRRKY
jgi:HemY protein